MSIVNCQQTLLKNCFTVRCLQFSSIICSIDSKRRYCTNVPSSNPLLNIKKLPRYKDITADVVSSTIPSLVKDTGKAYEKFELGLVNKTVYTWDNVVSESELICWA